MLFIHITVRTPVRGGGAAENGSIATPPLSFYQQLIDGHFAERSLTGEAQKMKNTSVVAMDTRSTHVACGCYYATKVTAAVKERGGGGGCSLTMLLPFAVLSGTHREACHPVGFPGRAILPFV